MILNKNTYKSLVNYTWMDLDTEDREEIVKAITGYPSHFEMNSYSKEMQQNIRDKMVELKYVLSLEEMRKR